MARPFNEYEKQVIQQSLIEYGKKLFNEFGFQKTSITDITKLVGIAQGTFYTFFQSKDQLYFAILEREEEKMREQLLNMTFSASDTPKDRLIHIIKKMIKMIETNQLIKDLYVSNQLEKMVQRLSPESLEDHMTNDRRTFELLIEKWRENGINITRSPEIVASIFRSLFLLTTHKREIGVATYRETMNFFIHSVAESLLKEE